MFITTVSGQSWPIQNPQPEDVNFKDIAEALAKIPRFSGHTPGYVYSVAQHSVHVSKILERAGSDNQTQLYGLLHDCHEGLGLGDIPTPIKQFMNRNGDFDEWLEIQHSFDLAIFQAASLPTPMPHLAWKAVRHADQVALRTEARDLMPQNSLKHFEHLPASRERKIKVQSWPKAMEVFLQRLNELLPSSNMSI